MKNSLDMPWKFSCVGTRSACINAATLALADAGIPMRDIVTSCSAGYLNSNALLGNLELPPSVRFCCIGREKLSYIAYKN